MVNGGKEDTSRATNVQKQAKRAMCRALRRYVCTAQIDNCSLSLLRHQPPLPSRAFRKHLDLATVLTGNHVLEACFKGLF